MVFEESEIQQKNVFLFVKILFQDAYSKGLIIFCLYKLQKSIENTDMLASISTDHSPLYFTLRRPQIIDKGENLWIFNSSQGQIQSS